MREKVRRLQYGVTLHAEEEMNDDGLTVFDVERCQMVCDICGQEGAHIRRVTRTYGKGKDLLVIENIPVVSCPHCGESYLTAETLHEIEQLKLHRKSLAVERPVEVVNFT